MLRPWYPEITKIITDAHVELLCGDRRRPASRRRPRPN